MRILAVTNMYPTPASPALGTFVEQQVEGLRRMGFAVDVLFADRARRGMVVYGELSRLLRARVDAFRPDLVHAMYGGITAAIVTRTVTHRPTVVTFHGSDLLGERLSGRVRNSLARLGVWASRRAARSASGIVVVSRGLRDALPTDVEHDMVRIIPCGIDLDRFRPLDRHACCARLGWDPDRFHVLFPANAGNRVKRPDLAEAAVRVAGGDGIPVELHYLRGVANIDVPTWVNASDVLLLTSLHEGSPTVVKEALACTVPVVSVDVGDVAERIADIEGCHLCDADPHHLARGLRAVHEAGQRLRETGDVQALSLERIAQRLACFYEEVRGDFDGQPTDVMTGRRLRVKESPGRTGSLTDA